MVKSSFDSNNRTVRKFRIVQISVHQLGNSNNRNIAVNLVNSISARSSESKPWTEPDQRCQPQSQSHSLFTHILLTFQFVEIGGQLRQPQLRPTYNKNPGQSQYINRRTVTGAIGEFHRLLSEFLPAFSNPRARRVFALIFSEHLRQIPDPAKIAILVRFIFAFLYTCIHIIRARTWYCFSHCQLAKIPIVTGRTEMLFL